MIRCVYVTKFILIVHCDSLNVIHVLEMHFPPRFMGYFRDAGCAALLRDGGLSRATGAAGACRVIAALPPRQCIVTFLTACIGDSLRAFLSLVITFVVSQYPSLSMCVHHTASRAFVCAFVTCLLVTDELAARDVVAHTGHLMRAPLRSWRVRVGGKLSLGRQRCARRSERVSFRFFSVLLCTFLLHSVFLCTRH